MWVAGLYDATNNRWIVAALPLLPNYSFIRVVVSRTSDPRGSFMSYSVPVDLTTNVYSCSATNVCRGDNLRMGQNVDSIWYAHQLVISSMYLSIHVIHKESCILDTLFDFDSSCPAMSCPAPFLSISPSLPVPPSLCLSYSLSLPPSPPRLSLCACARLSICLYVVTLMSREPCSYTDVMHICEPLQIPESRNIRSLLELLHWVSLV
jgi:hypothetical protein